MADRDTDSRSGLRALSLMIGLDNDRPVSDELKVHCVTALMKCMNDWDGARPDDESHVVFALVLPDNFDNPQEMQVLMVKSNGEFTLSTVARRPEDEVEMIRKVTAFGGDPNVKH